MKERESFHKTTSENAQVLDQLEYQETHRGVEATTDCPR